MQAVGTVLWALLWIFTIMLIVRVVVSWVQAFARSWEPSGVVLVLLEVCYTVTDVAIKPLRRLIPPLRIGQVMIDVSIILVFIIVFLLRVIVERTLLV